MKIIVSGNKYYGDEDGFAIVYEGEIKDILVKIAHNHSYRQFNAISLEDANITLDDLTVEQMMEGISELNGDGCDYITGAFIVEGNVKQLDI